MEIILAENMPTPQPDAAAAASPEADLEDAPAEQLKAPEAAEAEEAEEATADAGESSPALPLLQVVEAILFAAPEPLTLARLARAAGKGVRREEVRAVIDELNVLYLEGGRAFEIAEISGCFRLLSRPEFVEHVRRVQPRVEPGETEPAPPRLTPSLMETLAIVAYKQPVTKADIERIRGVNCDSALGILAKRGSVASERNAETLGSPRVYVTTEAFLTEFGLGSLGELPLRGELSAPPAALSRPRPAVFPESSPVGESA